MGIVTIDHDPYVGQSFTENGAWELAARHRHTGDLGTELRPTNPMTWILYAMCTCCFSVWHFYDKPLGGGRTYSRRVLGLTTADVVQVRVGHTFGPGTMSSFVAITVKGDTTIEADEWFKVVLWAPTGGATIAGGGGLATIRNDD